jgi:SAM-dependent methyltransferase
MSRQTKEIPFGERMAAILNHGALNLAMGVGYRLGLFDVMDRMNAPASADAIAREAELSPRYVQEWLGVMACGGIVAVSTAEPEGAALFRLPPAHGDLLASRAGNANLGVYTQEIPLLTASAMEAVVAAFRSGGGIGYAHYPDFHAFMSELADAKHRQVLVGTFLPAIEGGNLVRRLQQGIAVCDLGCAEGLAAMLMAQAFPRSRFTGVDLSAPAISRAVAAAREMGLANLDFICADAAGLHADPWWRSRFDFVCAFDAIHDQGRPAEALRSVLAMLRPGGLFCMVDIAAGSRLASNLGHPMGAFLYTVSLMHCLPVGLADDGAGLGMMWGRERALEMLAAAGFEALQVEQIPGDPFNLNFLAYRPR